MSEGLKTAKAYPPTVDIRLVTASELPLFDALMQRHHLRGALRRIGHELHYVATYREQWLALVSFSPAALQCAARDRWIGWHRQHRTDRLKLVANNSRFLILPGHHYPNLASRIVSRCLRRLRNDWLEQFNQPLLMLETYVDSAHHAGTIYRAAGWTFAGHTRGYRRISGGYSAEPCESIKLVFVKALQHDARRILCAPQLPNPYRTGVEKMKLTNDDYKSLMDYFEDEVDDFRRGQGKRHKLACVLALAAAAILSGARGYKDIWLWCDELSQSNRRHFRCRIVKGERLVPSITVLRNVMINVGPEALQRAISGFCGHHFGIAGEPIALDGKVLRGSNDADGRQVHATCRAQIGLDK